MQQIIQLRVKKNDGEVKKKKCEKERPCIPGCWYLIYQSSQWERSKRLRLNQNYSLTTSLSLALSPSLVSRSGWNVVTALRWCCRGLKSPSAYYPVRLNMQVEARGPTLKLQFAGPSTQRDNNTYTDTVLRLYTHLYTRMLVLSCHTNIHSAIHFCDANNHTSIHAHLILCTHTSFHCLITWPWHSHRRTLNLSLFPAIVFVCL